jgi:hypothetical protein
MTALRLTMFLSRADAVRSRAAAGLVRWCGWHGMQGVRVPPMLHRGWRPGLSGRWGIIVGGRLRFASWNVANRVGQAARRQGEFLGRLDPRPDVVLLQEANRRSVDTLCELAGMDWLHCAVDLRQPQPDDRSVRRRGVAIAGSVGHYRFTRFLIDRRARPSNMGPKSLPIISM